MKHEEKVREEIEMPTYTSAELDEFGKWLDQFRRDTENRSIDMQEAMVGFGAMSKKMQKIHDREVPAYSVIIKMQGNREGGKSYERPTKMELFEHKYEAWSRRQYAGQAQMEHYEDLAEKNADLVEDKTVNF